MQHICRCLLFILVQFTALVFCLFMRARASRYFYLFIAEITVVFQCVLLCLFLLLFCWNIYSYKWYCCILRVFIYTVKDWKFHISCRIQSIYLLFLYCIIKMQLNSCHSSVCLTFKYSIDSIQLIRVCRWENGVWVIDLYFGVACTIHCTFQKKLMTPSLDVEIIFISY